LFSISWTNKAEIGGFPRSADLSRGGKGVIRKVESDL
jgi:hypothetical protein